MRQVGNGAAAAVVEADLCGRALAGPRLLWCTAATAVMWDQQELTIGLMTAGVAAMMVAVEAGDPEAGAEAEGWNRRWEVAVCDI